MLCPLLALLQNYVHGIFGFLWWVLILLQQSLHQTAHIGTFRFTSVPVNGAVLSEHVCQFLSQFDKLIIRIEVLYCLRSCQGIIECFFLIGKSQIIALLLCIHHFLCHLQKFLNNFLIG